MRISDWSSDVCSSDLNQFRPIGDRGQLSALRDRYEIPSGRYLIGSFQRDSVASDLVSPKLVKGPDVFCEIIRQAMDLGAPVRDRKSTRLTPVTNAHSECRLLLAKKKRKYSSLPPVTNILSTLILIFRKLITVKN